MEEIEAISNGIEILVLIQYGIIDFTCEGCTSLNQEDGNCALGCRPIQDIKDSVYFSKELKKEYYSCPLSLIPTIVYELYDRYSWIKEFNIPQDGSMPSLLWWFVKKYNQAKSEVESYQHEERMKKLTLIH